MATIRNNLLSQISDSANQTSNGAHPVRPYMRPSVLLVSSEVPADLSLNKPSKTKAKV